MSETQNARVEILKKLVSSSLSRRKHAIVYSLARQMYSLLETEAAQGGPNAGSGASQWVPIESLSQLRAVVGGRFQNLKQRWTAAGFPLREHRGDRNSEAELDYEGWVELAGWIHKQGYDVRLAEKESGYLFEVKPRVAAE